MQISELFYLLHNIALYYITYFIFITIFSSVCRSLFATKATHCFFVDLFVVHLGHKTYIVFLLFHLSYAI
jgi:hypothetical protein